MVELTIEMESPFKVTGETKKTGIEKGETVEFNLTIQGDPTAPEMEAEIMFIVYGPADPMTDFSDPVWKLDGVKIDARKHKFLFPSGGSMTLDIFITILPNANWLKELRIRVDVFPYYRP